MHKIELFNRHIFYYINVLRFFVLPDNCIYWNLQRNKKIIVLNNSRIHKSVGIPTRMSPDKFQRMQPAWLVIAAGCIPFIFLISIWKLCCSKFRPFMTEQRLLAGCDGDGANEQRLGRQQLRVHGWLGGEHAADPVLEPHGGGAAGDQGLLQRTTVSGRLAHQPALAPSQ